MTLREIGDRLGISFARVKQIESKAIARLKNNPFMASLFF
jgi:DNA-directed RNA polymerase sigma subunit (sigma70/sigma32)